MADRGLTAALTEVNSVHAVRHLYRVTRGSVSRVRLHILFFNLGGVGGGIVGL